MYNETTTELAKEVEKATDVETEAAGAADTIEIPDTAETPDTAEATDTAEEPDAIEAVTEAEFISAETATSVPAVIEKIILSVKPVQLSDGHVVMFYNTELVNSQTIAFIIEIMETDETFRSGCHAVIFRNDGPPFEFDAEANKHRSSLGSYAHDALAVVINLEGIYEKTTSDIEDELCCESVAAGIYHLINRTVIHELIHGSDYCTTKDKWAWMQNPGEEGVEELAMLTLIEQAKTSKLIELPDTANSEAWVDKKIVGTIDEMRSNTGKKEDWEVNQLYMADNNRVYRSDDEEYGNMREYYRSMADDKDTPAWHQKEEAIPEPVTAPTESLEAMLGKAVFTGDMAKVTELMALLQTSQPSPPVVDADPVAGATVPVDSPFIDLEQVGANTPVKEDTSLLATMMANSAKLGPRPLTPDEQLVRNIFDMLFNVMHDKCTFVQGHWTTPAAILDPIQITIPGADQLIHSFDYTDGDGKYIKDELFGGVIKGQLDTRIDKLIRPAYVLHLKVNGFPVTRRLQPTYVLNSNGTVREIAPEKQATSLTFASQQGKQVAILRDPIEHENRYTLHRQTDGSVKWNLWDNKKKKKTA